MLGKRKLSEGMSLASPCWRKVGPSPWEALQEIQGNQGGWEVVGYLLPSPLIHWEHYLWPCVNIDILSWPRVQAQHDYRMPDVYRNFFVSVSRQVLGGILRRADMYMNPYSFCGLDQIRKLGAQLSCDHGMALLRWSRLADPESPLHHHVFFQTLAPQISLQQHTQ